MYHINSVGAVTQWEVVGFIPRISERHLKPLLSAMFAPYLFPIGGVHVDNGSEFINYTVAKPLQKLLLEFTRSRPSKRPGRPAI